MFLIFWQLGLGFPAIYKVTYPYIHGQYHLITISPLDIRHDARADIHAGVAWNRHVVTVHWMGKQ